MRKVIGLTGGIAAGKSTVSEYLRAKGYPVLDADEAARAAVAPGGPSLELLCAFFGEEILAADGSLDRAALAEKVFGSPEREEQLNAAVHGAVRAMLEEEIRCFRGRGEEGGAGAEESAAPQLLFVDVPLLFETGMDAEMDEVWVVDLPEEEQLARAVRRGLSPEQAEKRMAAQAARQRRLEGADHVLDNSGSEEALYAQIDALLREAGNDGTE